MSSVVTNTFGVAVIMVIMLTMREVPEINPTLHEIKLYSLWCPNFFPPSIIENQILDLFMQ